jgi:hypothetical protein
VCLVRDMVNRKHTNVIVEMYYILIKDIKIRFLFKLIKYKLNKETKNFVTTYYIINYYLKEHA